MGNKNSKTKIDKKRKSVKEIGIEKIAKLKQKLKGAFCMKNTSRHVDKKWIKYYDYCGYKAGSKKHPDFQMLCYLFKFSDVFSTSKFDDHLICLTVKL